MEDELGRRRNRKKSKKTAKEVTGERAHTNPGESADVPPARLPQSGTTENKEKVRLLQSIEPEGIKAIGSNHEWEMVDLAVDSGATETVVNEQMLESVEIKEGPASRRGVEYEVANGVRIPNLGEKRFMGVSEEGTTRQITAQVCDVNKLLLSVKKVVGAGNRVVFEQEGAYIEDRVSGERMWMREENRMYMLRMWVKKSPF